VTITDSEVSDYSDYDENPDWIPTDPRDHKHGKKPQPLSSTVFVRKVTPPAGSIVLKRHLIPRDRQEQIHCSCYCRYTLNWNCRCSPRRYCTCVPWDPQMSENFIVGKPKPPKVVSNQINSKIESFTKVLIKKQQEFEEIKTIINEIIEKL